jgi:hypothetical protein
MATTQNRPPDGDHPDGAIDEQLPQPDEDGPHDVPDENVIEKTLPTSRPHTGDSGPRPA